MGYIDDVLRDAQDMLWSEAPEEVRATESHVITRDIFDQMTWRTLNKQAKSLAASHETMNERFATASDAYEDLFNMLHQGDPQLVEKRRVRDSHRINHQLLTELAQSEELQELRKETRYDEYNAAFALLGMSQQIEETFVRLEQYRKAQEEAAQNAAQAAQNLQQQAQSGNPDPNALQEAMQALQDARAQQQQAEQAAQQAVQDSAQQIAQGMQETGQEIRDDAEAMNAYGVGMGELQQMNYDERRALSKRLNRNRMAKLAKLIGSFRSFGAAERRKRAKHAPSETYDYELSNDLTRIVPEEKNNLAVPELEEIFWLRWAQHALLTRKVRGPAKAGQGPIIICCDESGSMAQILDAEGNTREAWSKAVALALCEQARKENRDFTYIGFASGICYERQWKKGNIPLRDIADFVEHFDNGGTNFYAPLARALTIIEAAHKRDEPKPDIVLISDGDASLSDTFVKAWRKSMQKVDAKCFGIQIGSDQTWGADDDPVHPTLREVSDRVLHIDRLNANPEGVEALFKDI